MTDHIIYESLCMTDHIIYENLCMTDHIVAKSIIHERACQAEYLFASESCISMETNCKFIVFFIKSTRFIRFQRVAINTRIKDMISLKLPCTQYRLLIRHRIFVTRKEV